MEVFKLKFEEEPPYKKLNFLLSSVLLNQNKVPSLKFDWTRNKLMQLLENEARMNEGSDDDPDVADEDCDDDVDEGGAPNSGNRENPPNELLI